MKSTLIDKIEQQATRIDWPELVGYANEINDSSHKYKNQYLIRLYFRTKNWDKPCEFGQIRISQRLEGDYIMFYNYTYEQFEWAIDKKLDEQLDNNYFLVPYSKLPSDALEKLKDKAVNNYKK